MREPPVGLNGVGLVGTAMAERLLASGHTVLGYDIAIQQREQLKRLGGEVVSSARDVFDRTDVVLVSLPTSDIACRVLADVDVRRDQVVIDTTTGEPDQMVELGRRLADLGTKYLDATIAGSSEQVRQREALVMVGGDAGEVARFQGLLETFAARVIHVGPAGSAARMKLVVNLVLGLNRAVLAEGLSFARSIGVDPYSALEVLRASPASSRVMDVKGQKMLDEDFSVQARLAQHAKDVKLILDVGKKSRAHLPLTHLHDQLLTGLIASNHGNLDNSAIIKVFERM